MKSQIKNRKLSGEIVLKAQQRKQFTNIEKKRNSFVSIVSDVNLFSLIFYRVMTLWLVIKALLSLVDKNRELPLPEL